MNPDLLPEDRLRQALRTEAERVEPAEGSSLDGIRSRGRSAIVRRRAVISGLSAMVVAAGAFAAVSLLGDDDQTVIVDPGPEETTSSSVPEPTVTVAPTVPATTVPATEQPYLWPPPGHDQYTEPVDAARSFVTEYVGFAAPQFGETRDAEPGLVEVDVLALGEDGQPFGGRIWSTLQVAQAADGTWRVRSAASEDAVIEAVEATDDAVTVTGRGTGFEGTLNAYAIDAEGGRLGDPSIITVECCTEPQPFESTIAVPERPASVLVVSSTGLDGGSSFSAVPVPANTAVAVTVHFVGPDGTVQPFVRHVESPAVLNGALAALFAGPTPDDQGATTVLPVGITPAATIAGGEATVELPVPAGQTLPSDRAALAVEQLTRTVFQFSNIEAVSFEVGGSCEDFGRWTGLGECRFDR